MNVFCTAGFFLVAAGLTLVRGPGTAFALVYLPGLLLLSEADPVSLPMFPDATPPYAALYGILFASLSRGVRRVRSHREWWFPRRVVESVAEAGRQGGFQPTWTDLIVLLILTAYVLTALTTGSLRSGMNAFATTSLDLVYPYFLARFLLERPRTQRQMVLVLIGSSLVILAFALIEFRLWPGYFYGLLSAFDLGHPDPGGALGRFGYFRAMVSFGHPIDLAISGALIAVTIRMLALRCAPPVPRRWVQAGLGAAIVSSLTGVSFTAFTGIASALVFYWAVGRIRLARRLVVPGVALIILSGFLYTWNQARQPLPERPKDGGSSLELSTWSRNFVIHQVWEAATSSGPFGWGERLAENYEFESVDNAYLVFALLHGSVGLGLWLALPFCVMRVGLRALRGARTRRRHHVTLLGMATVLGTMVAMFTVWAGFVYATLFMIVIALTLNVAQAREAPRPRRAAAQREAPHRSPLRQPLHA